MRASRHHVLLIVLWSVSVDAFAKATDKEALVELYEQTNGASWVLHEDAPTDDSTMLPGGNYQWDLNSDPCPLNFTDAWHGVGCVDPCYYPIDGDDCQFGRITGLELGFNNLVGTIPPIVFDNLVNLTIVDVSHNSLSGTIPTQVGKLRNVMYAHLPRPAYFSAALRMTPVERGGGDSRTETRCPHAGSST